MSDVEAGGTAGTVRPLEETPEVAAAVRDDTTVPQLTEDGTAGDEGPEFVEPADAPPSDGAPPQP